MRGLRRSPNASSSFSYVAQSTLCSNTDCRRRRFRLTASASGGVSSVGIIAVSSERGIWDNPFVLILTAKSGCCMLFPLLALLVAVATAAGSLYMTLELGHKTCTLCFYQRAFAFALVGVLLT